MTQNKSILQYMKIHHGISQKDAVSSFDCYRLSARISDLRKMGYAITTETRTGRKPNGRPFNYAFYVLDIENSKGALEL